MQDLHKAWAQIKKVPHGEQNEHGQFQEGISFKSFETWWKENAGIVEPDIPVMPEYMVTKIAELSRGNMSWQGQAPEGTPMQTHRIQARWNSLGEYHFPVMFLYQAQSDADVGDKQGNSPWICMDICMESCMQS